MADPLAARIARETVHDLASAERIVADARRRNLTDDQITYWVGNLIGPIEPACTCTTTEGDPT